MDIQLFKSVFRSREDVFAVRWENGKKSGYMPAYSYDPYLYRAHKMRGGTFQNYQDKTYLPLSDREIDKHLNGEQLVGIYPLFPDNTSWFIAADFDDDNWLDECKTFLKVCHENEIPASPQISKQKTVKAHKINDLWAFCFLDISKIFKKYQSLGDLFGYPKI